MLSVALVGWRSPNILRVGVVKWLLWSQKSIRISKTLFWLSSIEPNGGLAPLQSRRQRWDDLKILKASAEDGTAQSEDHLPTGIADRAVHPGYVCSDAGDWECSERGNLCAPRAYVQVICKALKRHWRFPSIQITSTAIHKYDGFELHPRLWHRFTSGGKHFCQISKCKPKISFANMYSECLVHQFADQSDHSSEHCGNQIYRQKCGQASCPVCGRLPLEVTCHPCSSLWGKG